MKIPANRPSDIVAIIPARGGSKRIPRKNLVPVAGVPLVVHTVRHAVSARHIREVYVTTEDHDIAEVSKAAGARIIWRPEKLASDAATSEAALLHALDERRRLGQSDPDLLVFLQCTSPVRRPGDIDRAIETLWHARADSVLSACANSRFIWGKKNGALVPLNYDYRRRPREQDFGPQYRENGSIYVCRPPLLRRTKNRLAGKIVVYEMDYWSSFQIDTPEDVELCSWLLDRPEFRSAKPWPDRIGLVVFDFDGVMTDNSVWVGEDGSEHVRCNRGDGWGLQHLQDAGVPVLVLSTEQRPLAARRCAKLNIPCYHGLADKVEVLARYLAEHAIDPSDVVYVGNDVNDLPAMRFVGFPVAVADAHPVVREASRIVLKERGGHGAVREVCDQLQAVLARRRQPRS